MHEIGIFILVIMISSPLQNTLVYASNSFCDGQLLIKSFPLTANWIIATDSICFSSFKLTFSHVSFTDNNATFLASVTIQRIELCLHLRDWMKRVKEKNEITQTRAHNTQRTTIIDSHRSVVGSYSVLYLDEFIYWMKLCACSWTVFCLFCANKQLNLKQNLQM